MLGNNPKYKWLTTMVSFSFTLHSGSCRLAITLLYTPSHSRTQTEEVPPSRTCYSQIGRKNSKRVRINKELP